MNRLLRLVSPFAVGLLLAAPAIAMGLFIGFIAPRGKKSIYW